MTIKHTNSHYLLLPMLDIPYEKHGALGIQEVYIGCPEYQGDEDWGKYLYVTYLNWKNGDSELKQEIKSKSIDLFTNTVNGLITLVFEIPKQYEIDIQYFLRGEYSKMDRNYVEKNFPEITKYEGKEIRNPNRGVFDKADFLREAWRSEYNVEIPEDAEVWIKPDKARELLTTKKIQSNDPENHPMVSIGT